MKIRWINICGLLPYLYLTIMKYSLVTTFVFVNGVLYHSNSDNIYLKFYDILLNFIMSTIGCYYYINFRYYAFFGLICWLFNTYVGERYFYNRELGDIIHVTLTQYPLWLGIYSTF